MRLKILAKLRKSRLDSLTIKAERLNKYAQRQVAFLRIAVRTHQNHIRKYRQSTFCNRMNVVSVSVPIKFTPTIGARRLLRS